LLSLWACGQRSCVVHISTAMKVVSSRVFVMGLGPSIALDGSLANDGSDSQPPL
jgi:hypothetical protein